MKKVWALHKDEGEPLLINVKDIAAKRHLYTPKSREGKRDWSVDDKLTSLETTTSQVWPLIANDYVDLSAKHMRMIISLFISTLILRHPRKINEVKYIHEKMVDIWNQAPKGLDGRPCGSIIIGDKEYELDSSGWDEYNNSADYEHSMSFVSSIESNATYFAELLMKKRWSIVVAETPMFVTTDNPVVMQHDSKERYGIGTAGTRLIFPLSPTRILIMDDKFDEPSSQYYPLKEGSGPAYNQLLWMEAYRFMVSSRNPVGVLTEIIKLSENLGKNKK